MRLKGIKRGKAIELLQDIDLPDGAEVTIDVTADAFAENVKLGELEASEKLRRLNALFGCWKNQPELDRIFAAIDKERHEYRGREQDSF